jgi:pimeloyl-ACP methyl ester carboxylesterase
MPMYEADDGAALHFDVLSRDSAPPLVVLAGGAARHPEYLGHLAGLSEQHRLVVPHLRGVGRSETADLGERGSRWRQAEDVERLRASLCLDRCTVVGHSAGTRLAIAYVARFAERLSAVLLITPPAGYLVEVPPDAPAVAAARRQEPAFVAAEAAAEAGPRSEDEAAFNAWQQDVAPLGYARWTGAEQAHARSGRYYPAAARAFLDGETPADLLDRLREVQAPTLVVAGARDAIAGVAPVLAVAGLFPHGRSVVIDDAGHMPWVGQPAAFRAAVDPFLAAGDCGD